MNAISDIWKKSPQQTLAKAYEDNLHWCKSYVCKNNGTEEDAADIFQESISVAWLNLCNGRFEGDPEQFNAYIRQICKHKWINELRSKSKSQVFLSEDIAGFESMPDQEAIRDETAQILVLRASFDSIGEKCRDLLSGFYFKRQTLALLAKAMNLTEASVKTIKYRCMMRLRKAYLERAKEDE